MMSTGELEDKSPEDIAHDFTNELLASFNSTQSEGDSNISFAEIENQKVKNQQDESDIFTTPQVSSRSPTPMRYIPEVPSTTVKLLQTSAGTIQRQVKRSMTTLKSTVKSTASLTTGLLADLHVVYYVVCLIVFSIPFTAAYHVTYALQYHFNPDMELEELHAYLTYGPHQTRLPKL